jgi:hypothetical protein
LDVLDVKCHHLIVYDIKLLFEIIQSLSLFIVANFFLNAGLTLYRLKSPLLDWSIRLYVYLIEKLLLFALIIHRPIFLLKAGFLGSINAVYLMPMNCNFLIYNRCLIIRMIIIINAIAYRRYLFCVVVILLHILHFEVVVLYIRNNIQLMLLNIYRLILVLGNQFVFQEFNEYLRNLFKELILIFSVENIAKNV